MKKFTLAIAVVLAMLLVMVACSESAVTPGSTESETSAPTTVDVSAPETSATPGPAESETSAPTTVDVSTPETSATPTPTPTPTHTADPTDVVKEISVTLTTKDGTIDKTVTGEGSAVLDAGSKKLASGDVVNVKLAEGEKYFFFKLGSNLKEALIYAPSGEYTFKTQSDFKNYYPSSISIKVEVRYPTVEELTTSRNLALNPYDVKTKSTTSYPHAYSANAYNQSEFGAHCAIDGFKSNNGHGLYPLQSWGPNNVVKKTDKFEINFGREVTLDKLTLYIRADFAASNSHDAYFSEITVQFSDGTSVVINPTKTAKAQTFDLGGKTTSSIVLTGFVTDKTNSQGWAAITEIEVYGKDIVG